MKRQTVSFWPKKEICQKKDDIKEIYQNHEIKVIRLNKGDVDTLEFCSAALTSAPLGRHQVYWPRNVSHGYYLNR